MHTQDHFTDPIFSVAVLKYCILRFNWVHLKQQQTKIPVQEFVPTFITIFPVARAIVSSGMSLWAWMSMSESDKQTFQLRRLDTLNTAAISCG